VSEVSPVAGVAAIPRQVVVAAEKASSPHANEPAAEVKSERLKVVEKHFDASVSKETMPAAPSSDSIVHSDTQTIIQSEIHSTKSIISRVAADPSRPDAALPFQRRAARPPIQTAPPGSEEKSPPRSAPAISPPSAPQVTITIGRVEIRAAAAAAAEASPPPPSAPRLSLETYLRRSANRSA